MAPPPDLADLLERRSFPGMTARETRILQSWLRLHGAEWDTVDVEARLGAGVLLNPHRWSEKERADWYKRTRSRPDLIARRGSTALIVESKEQATSEAIWQVQGYRDLYRAEFPDHAVSTLVVCEEAHPTAVAVAASQGVTILRYRIPADEPLSPGAEAPAS